MHFSFLTMEADDEVKPIPAGPWFEMWIDPWPQPNRIYCCLCGGKNRSDDGWCFSKDTTFQRRSSSDEMMTMLRLMGAYGDSSRNLTRPLSKTQLYSYVCAYCREKDVNRSRMEFAQDDLFRAPWTEKIHLKIPSVLARNRIVTVLLCARRFGVDPYNPLLWKRQQIEDGVIKADEADDGVTLETGTMVLPRLPSEMLMMILHYLNVSDLMQNIGVDMHF